MPIPLPERLVGKLLIALWKRKHPPTATLGLVRAQRDELAGLIDAAGGAATTRVQIKRLPGLEASSTNYSFAMVARHLADTNAGMAGVVAALTRGERYGTPVVIADYKPSPSSEPGEAMAALDTSLEQLAEALADPGAIVRATLTHEHPWFGPLPASTWAVFPSFHQATHLKQARLIAAGLPVKA